MHELSESAARLLMPCTAHSVMANRRIYGVARWRPTREPACPIGDATRRGQVNEKTTGKHDDCRYFVLDPTHDPVARSALISYAHKAQIAGHPELAADLLAWVRSLNEADGRIDPWDGDGEGGLVP